MKEGRKRTKDGHAFRLGIFGGTDKAKKAVRPCLVFESGRAVDSGTLFLISGASSPRVKPKVSSAGRGAPCAAGARRTPPVVLGGIDGASACGAVERANVGDANFASEQVVEMSVDLGGSVYGNIHVFVADHVQRNNGSLHRRSTVTAIDIDSSGAGRCRVGYVGAISGDGVANDYVPEHVIRGSAKSGPFMRVESAARKTVARQLVPGDYVVGYAARSLAIGKESDSRASAVQAIIRNDVTGDGIVVYSVVGSEIGRRGTYRGMRRQRDAAFERVGGDGVVDDEIVMAFCRLIGNQYASSIAGNHIAGYERTHRAQEVKSAAAVAGFVGFIGWLTQAGGTGGTGPLFVVIDDLIIQDGGVRGVEYQNPFVQSILHSEARDGNIAQSGIAEAV